MTKHRTRPKTTTRNALTWGLLATLAGVGAAAGTKFGDLDGNGRADLVLRHAEDGTWTAYDLDGDRTVQTAIAATRNRGYHFAGMGDFDGDGDDELLLRHADNGNWIAYAFEDGRAILRRIGGATRNLRYELQGIGDFDGDGEDELLLRHANNRSWIAYTIDGNRAKLRRIAATRNAAYVFAGVGDFDGDGTDEFVLRHATKGNWIGYAIGTGTKLLRHRGTDPHLDHDIVGVGDFDGDGADEVLSRDPGNGSWGRVAIEAGRVVAREHAGLAANRRHGVAGIGDFDGDGADEVLVRDTSNGDWIRYVWDGDRAVGRTLAGITNDGYWRAPHAAAEPLDIPPDAPTVGLGDIGTTEEERARLFAAVGRDVFGAAYADFRDGADALKSAVETHCAAPTADQTALEAAWRGAMLAWQRAQYVYVGPVKDESGDFRIQFFPDRNEIVERDVRRYLNGTEPLTEETIASQSVGGQGLPALEFLFFDIGGLDDAVAGPRRCDLAEAVAANLATMAGEVADAWGEDGDFVADFVNAEGVFNGPEDVLIEILTALAQHAEFIGDRKLKPAFDTSNPEALESHYAHHSAQNIAANVQAFRELFDSRNDGGYRLRDYLERVYSADAITAQIAERFDTIEQTLAGYEASLEQIVGGHAAGDTETLYTTVQKLADLGVDAAVAVGVELGFNNQDGD